MKKNVWILNHYAVNMMYQRGGRHYWMAKELLKNGYRPIIFCANVVHNSKDIIEIDGVYRVEEQDGIVFVIVKTPSYTGNGFKRINNILGFYRNVKKAMRKYRKEKKVKPNVILASHVHPLTCVAGLQMRKKWNVPCIVEIRDLWPAELIATGAMRERSLAASLLYRLEKYLYQKADAVVFTIAGGAKYISDKKWDKDQGGTIDLSKIFYINNGVDIQGFDENAARYPMHDEDLNDGHFNLVYTGSIRRVNQIDTLLDTAKELVDEPQIQILIWGAGDYVNGIKKRIQEEKITNIKYKGVVKKQEIPGILIQSDANVVHWQNMDVLKYGCSYNKLFEYFAAGKPVFSTVHTGYSILKDKNCGMEAEGYAPEEFAEDIKKLYHMTQKQREALGRNARAAAEQFDFAVLTEKLIDIIEDL